jgi:hypothetical protein
MTNRERMLAVLDHGAPDRLPFSPRLDLWYNARRSAGDLPVKWRDATLREIERDLGLVTPARNGRVFAADHGDVEVVSRREGPLHIEEHRTPLGTVRTVTRRSEFHERAGMGEIVEEYPLKTPTDYRVWEHVVEHTTWRPAPEDYAAYDEKIGEDGLPLVSVGDVPFHHFAQKLAGYENAFYHLADWPEEVDRLLATMMRVERERLWPVIAGSSARLLLHGAHISSQMTPRPLFERYILPYYRELIPMLHAAGKTVAMHADADLSLILDLVQQAGWDMLECFVTAPMVPLTMERTRAVLGTRTILWGGVPSIILSPYFPEDKFRRYVQELLQTIAPGEAVILGVADNVMPDSLIERVRWISELVAEAGYPLSA